MRKVTRLAAAGSAPASDQEGVATVATQGLSPIMAQALHTRGDRLSAFDNDTLTEIQNAVLTAINPIADRLGIAIDRVALENNGSLADLKIEMSIVDALGLDRHARTLLERGQDAGVPPAWFGRHLRLRAPLDRRIPATGKIDVYITGLVEAHEGIWRARLYDPDNRRHMFASPRMIQKLVQQYG